MKTFLKVFFALLFFIFILCIAGLFIISSSPAVMQNLVMFGADNLWDNITIRNLVIKKQDCAFPKQCTFHDVSLSLEQGEETYILSFKTITISGMTEIISSGKGMTLQVRGGTVKSSAFRLDGLRVDLTSEHAKKWIGPVSVKEAESNGFQVRDIHAKAVMESKEAVLSDISGDSYQGKITGTATVYFMPKVHYFADVAFDDLDTVQMENVNPSLFSQVRGQIYGTIQVRGPAGELEEIHMDVRLNDGGEIQAKIFALLLQHIPMSIERKRLETAIKDNRLIRVNNAQLKLGNQDSKTVSADIQLKSDNLNLDVNVTVDIIIEGGIQNLLKYFTQLAQMMKGK